MSELRGFVYKCDCIKPMIESIVEKLMPLEEVTEAYLDPVSLSGITGTSLEYKTANKKKKQTVDSNPYVLSFLRQKIVRGA